MVDFALLRIKVDSASVRNAQRDFRGFQDSTSQLDKGLRLLTRAAASLGAALSVREIVQYADAWQGVTNQLKTVRKDGEDLASTQDKLVGLANKTRSGFESTANLYTRLSRATENLGLSQEELIELTGTINQSFAVSGATAQEASNAITQLSQGLAAGALRGEEFNSVSEQSPILLQAISDNLQMTRGELRDFAAEGGITAEVVIESLRGSAEEIDRTFSKMSATFGQNITVARNNLLEFVGNSESVESAVGFIGESIVSLSESLEGMSATASDAFSIMGAATEGWADKTIFFVGAVDQGFRNLFSNINTSGLSTANLLSLSFGTMASNIQTAIEIATIEISAEIDRIQADANEFRRKDAAFTFKFLSGLGLQQSAWAQAQKRLYEDLSSSGQTLQERHDAIGKAARDAAQDVLRSSNDRLQAMFEEIDAAERAEISIGEYSGTVETATKTGNIFNVGLKETGFRMMGVTDATAKQIESLRGLDSSTTEATDTMSGLTSEVDLQANMVENLQREWANLIQTFITGESDIGDFFDTFAKGIARMFSEAASADLMSMVFNTGQGGNLANAGSTLMSLGTSAAGAVGLGSLGTTGGWVAPSMANAATLSAAGGGAGAAGAGGGFMSSVGGFLTSPAGIAAMVAVGGKLIHDATNDPDGRHRGMAGFLAAPTPGAPAGSQFQVDPFASGFRPTGFADGPVSRQDAERLIEQFRFLDETIVDAVVAAGGRVAAPGTLGGFGLEGTGAGTFFGRSDITTDAQLQRQLNSFALQIGQHIEGLSPDTMAQLMGANSAQEMVDILGTVADSNGGLSDQVIELVRANDYVVNSQGNLIDSNGSVVATMEQLIGIQESLPGGIESALTKAYEQAYAAANAPARVNESVVNRDPGMVYGNMGDPGTHFVDGELISPITFAESKRQERVADNLRMLQYGFDFSTNEWDSISGRNSYYEARREPVMPPPMQSYSSPPPSKSPNSLTGLTVDEEIRQLLMRIEKNTSGSERLLDKFDGDGLPEERS